MEPIRIKEENKGKFTKKANSAGMGVQEFAHKVLSNKGNYSPTTVKQANFARNFGGKAQSGATLNPYQPNVSLDPSVYSQNTLEYNPFAQYTQSNYPQIANIPNQGFPLAQISTPFNAQTPTTPTQLNGTVTAPNVNIPNPPTTPSNFLPNLSQGLTNIGVGNGTATTIGAAIGHGGTGLGNALGTVSPLLKAIPGPAGQIASMGVDVIGGLVNGIFGKKQEMYKNEFKDVRQNSYNPYANGLGSTALMKQGGNIKGKKKAQDGEFMPINNTGYLDGSRTANNTFNIIPDSNITMQGVSQPIMAYPNNDSPTLMYPNENYNFPNSDYVTEIPIAQSGTTLTSQNMQDWNNYVNYLASTGNSGNKKMNNIDYSKSQLEAYRKANPNTTITSDLIPLVQTGITNYRNYTIDQIKQGKAKTAQPLNADSSNFMPWVLGTGVDGINGEYTSQFRFPKQYMTTIEGNKRTTEDRGFAVKQSGGSINEGDELDLTPEQIRQLISQGYQFEL